jgi:hypothetical protein
VELGEAKDGLEAAWRLSEQLDRQNEALQMMKVEGREHLASLCYYDVISNHLTVVFFFTKFVLVSGSL